MFLYEQLNQKNVEHFQKYWNLIDDLYCGGYQMERNARRYLTKYVGEHPDRYNERCDNASYINYLGQIVDQFVANVFSQELSVTPAADSNDESTPGEEPEKPEFYIEFEADADMCGTSFEKIIRKVFTTSILKKRALLAIDTPNLEAQDGDEEYEEVGAPPDDQAPYPINRSEEESMGTDRAYAFEIPIEYLYDWKLTGPSQFEWAVLGKCITKRGGPGTPMDTLVEQFKVWTMVDGFASWEIWETEPFNKDKRPSPKDPLILRRSGTTTFRAIPLMLLEVPDGLWVGNKLGGMALEHFRRRSALVAAENRSLFAIPYITLGEEIGAPGYNTSEVQQNPGRAEDGPQEALRKKGWMLLGKDDGIHFAEPTGQAYEIIHKELDALVNEMFRVTHQMSSSVASTNHGVYRSGKSKVEDRNAMEIVLSAYGSIVRAFVKRTFDFISTVRNDNIIWTAHGLTTYELEDRDLLIKEAAFAESFDIPSKTFRIAHKTKVAFALVGQVPSATKQTIRKEIIEGVAELMEHEDLETEMEERMMKDNVDAPDGAHAPGMPGGDNKAAMLPADSTTHHPHRAVKEGNKKIKPTGRMSMPHGPANA